jgi:hypothetical protein
MATTSSSLAVCSLSTPTTSSSVIVWGVVMMMSSVLASFLTVDGSVAKVQVTLCYL